MRTMLPVLALSACLPSTEGTDKGPEDGTVACDDDVLDLSGVNEDARTLRSGCTYEVHLPSTFHGPLTIEPGVTIVFDPDTALTPYGGLDAQGTADAEVVLTGAQAGSGTWDGLWLDASDPSAAFAIHHLRIEGAGAPDDGATQTGAGGALNVVEGVDVLVEGLEVTGSVGYGFVLWGTLAAGSDGLAVDDAALGAAYVSSESMRTLPRLDSALSVWVDGIGETGDGTWVSQAAPLELGWGSFDVIEGTLTLEPNVLRMGPDTSMYVGAAGVADLVATDVDFVAADPAVGWAGLTFEDHLGAATRLQGGSVSGGVGPEYPVYSEWITGVVTVADPDPSTCNVPAFDGVAIDALGLADACVAYHGGCTYCPAPHYEGQGPASCAIEQFYADPGCAP